MDVDGQPRLAGNWTGHQVSDGEISTTVDGRGCREGGSRSDDEWTLGLSECVVPGPRMEAQGRASHLVNLYLKFFKGN